MILGNKTAPFMKWGNIKNKRKIIGETLDSPNETGHCPFCFAVNRTFIVAEPKLMRSWNNQGVRIYKLPCLYNTRQKDNSMFQHRVWMLNTFVHYCADKTLFKKKPPGFWTYLKCVWAAYFPCLLLIQSLCAKNLNKMQVEF